MGSGRAVPRPCLPGEAEKAHSGGSGPTVLQSRSLPTYRAQMLFVLPASHGLGPSDKLVLWTYVVAIMGMLTSRSPCWGQAACTPPLRLAASALGHTQDSIPQSSYAVHSWAFFQILACTVSITRLTLHLPVLWESLRSHLFQMLGRQLLQYRAGCASKKTLESGTVTSEPLLELADS